MYLRFLWRQMFVKKGPFMINQLTIHENSQPCYNIVLSEDYNQLQAALEMVPVHGRKVCIVSDSHVAPYYLERITGVLGKTCALVVHFLIEAGEASKTLDNVEKLYEFLIIHQFERKDFLAALGGGVIGDLTGFAAATYLRGIPFIQIPTSLLAQVDSSIGGKTGVDFKSYKNMVGAFHQPALVYSSADALLTLNSRQYLSGMGEIIKHGLICDAGYYDWLIMHREDILGKDLQTLNEMIYRSDRIKQAVVEEDPHEKGIRAILNFGHTLGHAVEKLSDFDLLHGECVSIGIRGAAWLSMNRGYITADTYQNIINTLLAFELPVHVSGLRPEEIVNVTKSDKKMDKGSVRFILLSAIGEAVICHDVSDAELMMAAREICNL